jgi:16S rRNA (guanine527-N7)-methyltransferase
MDTQAFATRAGRLVPGLTRTQLDRLLEYERLLLYYNRRTNLVSTDSALEFRLRHLLHSLCLAGQGFPAGTVIADWGTGGGLPGLPLAICFPRAEFHLVDSSRKKHVIVQSICARLGLDNVRSEWTRAEMFDGQIHFAVSRATAPLRTLWAWTTRASRATPRLSCLKGGDLDAEIAEFTDAFPETVVDKEDLRLKTGLDYFDQKYAVRVR